jgi:hypothetical protein
LWLRTSLSAPLNTRLSVTFNLLLASWFGPDLGPRFGRSFAHLLAARLVAELTTLIDGRLGA